MSDRQARSTVFVDNERVRVSAWRFDPGAATGHHRHEFDYVVVPTTGGDFLIHDRAGETAFRMEPGKPYFREAGVEHDVINTGETDAAFIEIEIK